MNARDYVALARQYEADVLSGLIPACQWVKLAVQRNQRDLARQDTPSFPFRFDPLKARRICQMAELLPHVKGPKAKIIGQDDHGRDLWATIELEPWQCWVYTTLHGWVNADDLRRFRLALILVARKNTKSTMGAIEVLDGLTLDSVIGAEIVSAATTRDQAKVVAEIAWLMAKRSPQFREYFGVRMGSETTKSLTVPATGAKFGPLSADANSLDGLNIFRAVVDELHAHKTRGVWDVLDTATGTQLEPLLIAITTAGVELGGICHEKLQYLEKILDGVIEDDRFFGINYTIDPGDDIRDPLVQRKANPNYGVSVQADDLAGKIAGAQHSPAALNNVLTKHFNVWVRSESAWLSATLWQACATLGLTFESLREFPCWIGVDLAEVRDIAALIFLFKTGPETYALIGRFYWPADTIDHSPIAAVSGYVHGGHIIETLGSQTDFKRIEADIIAACQILNVKEIDFDRALAAHMLQDLKAHFEPTMGRDAADRFLVTVPQNVETMDAAMKMTERLVLAKKLQHDGNPAMAWMISNVVIERNHKDEIYPRKAGGKDSPNKIDGPVAFFTCLSQAMNSQIADPQYQVLVFGR